MESTWTQLVTTAVTSSIFASCVVWLLREYISAELQSRIQLKYDSELARIVAALEGANAIELERVRSELLRQLQECQIQLSNVQPEVCKAVAQTYASLLDLYHQFELAANIQMAPFEQRRIEALKELSATESRLESVFLPGRIYLSAGAVERITKLVRELSVHGSVLRMRILQAKDQGDTRAGHGAVSEAYEALGRDLRPRLREIEDELRRTIGITAR